MSLIFIVMKNKKNNKERITIVGTRKKYLTV